MFDKFDDDLAEIATVQHRQESRGGILEAAHNVFAIANGAIADALFGVVKKLDIEVFGELIVNVPAQRETFGENGPHRGRKTVFANIGLIVLSDEPAYRHARELVLGIVILGLLIMTGAVDREQAGAMVGRAIAVMILVPCAFCIVGMAVGAVVPLLKHVLAWTAIVALVIRLLFLARTISLVKKFLGFEEDGGSYE